MLTPDEKVGIALAIIVAAVAVFALLKLFGA